LAKVMYEQSGADAGGPQGGPEAGPQTEPGPGPEPDKKDGDDNIIDADFEVK